MAFDTLQKRLEKKQVRRGPDECWPWTGYINEDGEARIWVDDAMGSISVPKALFLIRDGEVKEGMEALSCPILKECSNPGHISLVSRDEVADRILWTKGLSRKRSSRRPGDLTDEQVRQIYLSTAATADLAKQYDVSEGQISNIRAGRRRRDVTDPLRRARDSARHDAPEDIGIMA